MQLSKTCTAWGSDDFEQVLKAELAAQAGELPLIKAMEFGSQLGTRAPTVTLLSCTEGDGHLLVKVGVFFTSIIAGCNCADDPTPMDENNEYAEMRVSIDRADGAARVDFA